MTAKRVQSNVCHGVELIAQSQKLLVGEIGKVGIDAAALLQGEHEASLSNGLRGVPSLFTDAIKEGCIQPICLLRIGKKSNWLEKKILRAKRIFETILDLLTGRRSWDGTDSEVRIRAQDDLALRVHEQTTVDLPDCVANMASDHATEYADPICRFDQRLQRASRHPK